ncbi:MAG: LysR family transcriptional regulator [Actinomycetota bacterium]|nr:LysR family transcriptional regulator [Actinomycetota bacterium]
MDLDVRLVRYFVAVADELHFGRAAANLYISQPALSKQIRKLEDQLGTSLLVRDSRHVSLTPRGRTFLEDARELLAIAARMQQPAHTDGVRIAHIFELETSRLVADAFSRQRPEVDLFEHAMSSSTQLEALLDHRIDVAILRVTAEMVKSHPAAWSHRLLRLEPLLLVGGPSDRPTGASASLYEQPLHVFGDPPDSGTYNVHGQYLTAFERELGITMRWLGTPGAFSHCLTHVTRSTGPARYLEFSSYAQRYAAAGLPVYRPQEAQPYYPWSLAWREGDQPEGVAAFVSSATALARANDWLSPDPVTAPAWLPGDDPAVPHLQSKAAMAPVDAARSWTRT